MSQFINRVLILQIAMQQQLQQMEAQQQIQIMQQQQEIAATRHFGRL